MQSKLIIAIDGYSSCGKSTVAKDIAKKLNIVFVDSGAMYRCVTLYALQNGIISNNIITEDKLRQSLSNINITFKFDAETKSNETFLNGVSVENEIRDVEVSNNVSTISAIGFVRKDLVRQQQNMAQTTSLVMDGRDIGTVVFPNADLKLFMTASPQIRAERRFKEFKAKNSNITFDEVIENIVSRDRLDETRSESPLTQANDAVVLDNSNLTQQEQLDFILDELKKRELI